MKNGGARDTLSSPVNGGSVPANAGTMGAPPRIRLQEGSSRALAKKLRKQLTDAETILWSKLRGKQLNGLKFRRQHPIKAYVADFACIEARLVIEVDGATHSTEAEREHDAIRSRVLAREGWRILRVKNEDVTKNLYQTLQLISRSARCAPSVLDCVQDTSPASGGGKPAEKE
jgi:very-short-patch-repair endonuclease